MNKNLRQATIDTYNKSAKELAEYFRGIRSRTKYIDSALKLAGNPKNPTILEIGCGDGRDAKEIVKRTSNYVGFDISEELIKLAREHVPEARFEVADAVAYEYGENKFDAVFAFAALLHLDKEEVRSVLEKVARALKPGGVFYISLKHRKTYQTEVKEDKYGKRLFYFYNPELIKELAANLYEVASEDIEKIGGTNWLEMTLRRK